MSKEGFAGLPEHLQPSNLPARSMNEELSREQVEAHLEVVNCSMSPTACRDSVAKLLATDAALRASRDAERERAEKAERALIATKAYLEIVENGQIAHENLEELRNKVASLATIDDAYHGAERQVADLTAKLEAIGQEHALSVLALRKGHQETLLNMQQQLADAQATVKRLEAEVAMLTKWLEKVIRPFVSAVQNSAEPQQFYAGWAKSIQQALAAKEGT